MGKRTSDQNTSQSQVHCGKEQVTRTLVRVRSSDKNGSQRRTRNPTEGKKGQARKDEGKWKRWGGEIGKMRGEIGKMGK